VITLDNPWRPAHELKSAVVWLLAAITGTLMAPFASVPVTPILVAVVISLALSVYRVQSVYRLWEGKANLQGRAVGFMTPAEIVGWMDRNPSKMFLGYGFDWVQKHVQRLYDLKKRDVSEVMPPDWYLDMRKRWANAETGKELRGEEWIHGLEPRESELSVPLVDLEGNTIIFGTTGSGKTRCFEIICTQIIHRKNSVLVILDPKGDIALRQRVQLECGRAGKSFMHFHPAFPSMSVRLDPLKNWQHPREIASRVSSLIKGDSGDSVYKEFAWRAINQIVEALVEIEERPNLLKIRRYIEGGPDHLLHKVLEAYFAKCVPDWEARIDPYIKKAAKGEYNKERPAKTTPAELMAYVRFYKAEIPESERTSPVDGLVSMFEHNRDHQMKLIASLLPLLTQLTSGEVGQLLSPDGKDPNDIRPILDTGRIIDARQVLYVGLDALSDPTVASAIGAILLADLASVAGHRYNYGGEDVEVNLVVDESAECITPPFVQILNKARGAGFKTYFAAQTMPDFEARTGNKAMARMILGNANNLIALRTMDVETQSFITEKIGRTSVYSIAQSQGVNAATDGNPAHFSGGFSERLAESEADVFPADMLGKLPDLQFVAFVSGGRIIKGRLPLITRERTPKLEEFSWLQGSVS